MILAAPASAGTVSPNSDGSWPPLPNSTSVELQHDPKTVSASGRVQVALTGEGAAARKVLIQSAYQRPQRSARLLQAQGDTSCPRSRAESDRPGSSSGLSKMLAGKASTCSERSSIPSKDCKLVKDEEDMKFKIEIPGNKIHTLPPMP